MLDLERDRDDEREKPKEEPKADTGESDRPSRRWRPDQDTMRSMTEEKPEAQKNEEKPREEPKADTRESDRSRPWRPDEETMRSMTEEKPEAQKNEENRSDGKGPGQDFAGGPSRSGMELMDQQQHSGTSQSGDRPVTTPEQREQVGESLRSFKQADGQSPTENQEQPVTTPEQREQVDESLRPFKQADGNTPTENQERPEGPDAQLVKGNELHNPEGEQKTQSEATDPDRSSQETDDPYRRPTSFRQGVRDAVWDNAKDAEGIVRDPQTGAEMSKDEPWDMGHKPGYEFRKHQDSARDRGISRQQFLDEHNNPDHYRPELPSSNRNHKGEDMTDDYFGP